MLECTDVDCINIQAVWHGGASFVIGVFVCRVVVDFTQNMHDTAHYGRCMHGVGGINAPWSLHGIHPQFGSS